MRKVKFYIIAGWRLVTNNGTDEYIRTTYTVDTLDEVIKALKGDENWQYFKLECVEPVYFWD